MANEGISIISQSAASSPESESRKLSVREIQPNYEHQVIIQYLLIHSVHSTAEGLDLVGCRDSTGTSLSATVQHA